MSVPTDEEIVEIYRTTQIIAVVGASTDEEKAAHRIPRYLQSQGYRIIPVNPFADEIWGEPAVDSLADIDVSVDVVDVFRPSDEAPDIAREAVEIGASVLWLQIGIESDAAAAIAEEAGLTVVMDRCLGATHQSLRASGAL